MDAYTAVDMTTRKALLQYLVRMGSFTSSHKISNEDTADNDVEIPEGATWEDLLARCKEELEYHPPKIRRHFRQVKPMDNSTNAIKIMQWNILAQALATGTDNFVACPEKALSWHSIRRWRILEEIVSARPDIMCFQEVDHYQFLQLTLGRLGYKSVFCPKPDSPCYYVVDNNGPDGCAIFYDESKFESINTVTRTLEVWGYQSNQVAILCHFRRKVDKEEFCVVTTHLKARQGPLLSTMRHEQGKDLLDFVKMTCGDHLPVIVTGDFNASPQEAVYLAMTEDETLQLDSAYRYLYSRQHLEPSYTTWTIREDGEQSQTLDYIFFSKGCFQVNSLLLIPTSEDLGEGRAPSYTYPSDHFSLVTELSFTTVR